MTFCSDSIIKSHPKKWFGLLAILLLCGSTLFAQTDSSSSSSSSAGAAAAADDSLPRTELTVNYEFTHLSSDFQGTKYPVNLHGWSTSLTGYFTDRLGVTAEFGGKYGQLNGYGADFYTILFGPTYRRQIQGIKNTRVFGHILFGNMHGQSRLSPGMFAASGTVNQFTVGGGGGIDITYRKHIAFRPVQVDYFFHRLPVQNIVVNSTSFRYTPGIVFQF